MVNQHVYDKLRINHYNRLIKNIKIFIINSITIKSKVTKPYNASEISNCEKSLNHSQTDIPMLNNLNLACFIFLILK